MTWKTSVLSACAVIGKRRESCGAGCNGCTNRHRTALRHNNAAYNPPDRGNPGITPVIHITASQFPWADAVYRRAYTVKVSRKGAWVMLVIMALWAVAPAIACLAPAQQHACCRDMMPNCGSSTMDASSACCQARSSETAYPSAQAAGPDRAMQLFASQSIAGVLAPALTYAGPVQGSNGPSISPPGSPVLRI